MFLEYGRALFENAKHQLSGVLRHFISSTLRGDEEGDEEAGTALISRVRYARWTDDAQRSLQPSSFKVAESMLFFKRQSSLLKIEMPSRRAMIVKKIQAVANKRLLIKTKNKRVVMMLRTMRMMMMVMVMMATTPPKAMRTPTSKTMRAKRRSRMRSVSHGSGSGYEHKLADTLEALGSLAVETGTTTYPRPTLTLTLLNSSWSSPNALLHHVWDRSISNPCVPR